MSFDLAASRAEHATAVATFLLTARRVPATLWNTQRPGDKWSPAQIAEHVRLSYLAINRELAGGQGLRLRTSFWLRPILRIVYLRKLLRTGIVPKGARAPREIRPDTGPFDRETTLTGIGEAAAVFEERLAAIKRGQALTHHVFGRLDGQRAWRFMTVHTEHHRRQLEPG